MRTHDSDGLPDDESAVYDDPYEVVMYDIDTTATNNVSALVSMLTDPKHAWFAKRRLDGLVASGTLNALVADIIIDSLGRRWDPLLHPRDRFGQFIETGGFFRWFMNGKWSRGQVVRIDSDGVIHARSDGNDGIPDGTPLRFNNKQASKLVSTASDKADLTPDNLPDLNAEIPDFPEASATQRRIYNALQYGDMPGQDLFIYRAEELSGTEFANEVTGLAERNLISTTSGDKARVSRNDQDALGIVDIGDDQIADVPDDETPDLDDSPALTKAQRALIDNIADLDRGEGDGVTPDEIPEASDEDLQALVDAGVLDREGDGPFHLTNPNEEVDTPPEAVDVLEDDVDAEVPEVPEAEEVDADVPEAEVPEAEEVDEGPAPDIADLLDTAAQKQFPDDLEMQEAFIHHGAVLALPDYDGEAPEGLRPAQDRRARSTAEAWWEEYNAPEPDADAPEEDVEAGPKGIRFDRADSLRRGRDLLGRWLSDEQLDEPEGEDYSRGVGYLIHAADLEEAGEGDKAETYKKLARTSMLKAGVPEEEIDEWDPVIDAYRNEQEIPGVPEAEEVDVPEEEVEEVVDVPEEEIVEDLPEADLPEEEIAEEDVLPDPGGWETYNQQLADEGVDDYFNDKLEQERRISEGLGLNLFDGDAPDSWNVLAVELGEEEAARLHNRNDGDLAKARTEMAGPIEDTAAPDAGVPEDAPEADSPDDGQDRQQALDDFFAENTDGARPDLPEPIQRVAGEDVDPVVPEDVPEDTASDVDPLSAYSDEERALLEQLGNGNAVRRNQRDIEDSLFDKGLLEEDENGDTRLSQAGNETLALLRGEETAVDDVAEAPAPEVPEDVDVPEDAPEAVDVPDADVPEDVPDADVPDADAADSDAVPTAASAPELPDPTTAGDAPGFRWVSGAGGLNAGGVYEVTEDSEFFDVGELIYVKNGRSYEHAQNELLANKLYELAGVPVPETLEGSTGDRIASRIVPGVQNFNPHDPNNREVLDVVRSQFAIDAWIANWDGMNPGNTMIDGDGNPYRIDVGSAMEYRAQGGLKGPAFSDKLNDLDSLRDKNLNYEMGTVFGSMSEDEVRASVESLAQVDPAEIRSTILASNLPDKDALAEKMLSRRSDALERYGVADPFAPNADVEDDVEEDDNVLRAARAVPSVYTTPQQITSVKTRTADATKKLQEFLDRTNPNIEPEYDDNGTLLDAKGDPLDFSTYYRKARGGEGKNGLIVEVLDQDRYPGFVLMEYQDGSREARHVRGVGTGTGGLVPSSQEDIDSWERQTRVVDGKADVALPEDWPMGDGTPSASGTPVAFEVGGEEFYGVLLYFNPKHDKTGRGYIMPEGGGKPIQRPLGKIRSQTQDEMDSDATPLVPYEKSKKVQQYLPPPRFTASGQLMSREDMPISVGDWMGQRAGGDSLVGEVIDVPDQNLYPGWVTLRFPDGEVRSRHVEGFTDINKVRGTGGLRHVDPPDLATWNRQRRVVGEEGEVLSYDFSDLETLDGTEIKVGEAVFGKDRLGQDVAGLLIRINPHVKRNGETVPVGYVWQNGKEVPVEIRKVTNTLPATPQRTPRPTPAPRPVPTAGQRTPRTPTPGPTSRPAQQARPTSQPGTGVRPTPTTANPAPAYGPGRGRELSEEEIFDLDIDRTNLYTSDNYTGVHAALGAIAEAQEFDGLPQVVGQAEYVRLVEEEGYVPILRRVGRGSDPKTGLKYDQSYPYGRYYAGDGIHGYGNYFGYGRDATDDVQYYGSESIFALVKPEDLNSIDELDLIAMWQNEVRSLRNDLAKTELGTPEYDRLKKKIRLYDNNYGEYAAAKGYDAIIAPGGNYRPYTQGNDPDLRGNLGYIVILNRSATIVSDTPFDIKDDIFRNGFPATLAPDVPSAAGPSSDPVAPSGDVV